MQEQENVQEQKKQTPEEKEKATILKNEITTLRIILLCLAGIFSVYIPTYLGIHVEWVEEIVGLIVFFSTIGLLCFVFVKSLTNHPIITAFVFYTFLFLFFTITSFITSSKDAAFILRIFSLFILIIVLWIIYMNIGTFILFIKKRFSFVKFSQNIGKAIGFLSVAALLILTIIQIFKAFHK